MDFLQTVIVIILCILIFNNLPWIRNQINRSNKGPRKTVPEIAGSWPIKGHLHLLAGNQVPHKRLGSMADEFGPIFTIKLGVHRVLVVSNSEMAKECFTTNDRVFASRPRCLASKLMGYNYAAFGLSPYGPYWREMRKITVLEMASHRHLQTLAHIRISEVKLFIIDLYRTWTTNKGLSATIKVELKQWFGDLIMNMVLKTIFGNLFSPGQQDVHQFEKAFRQLTELFGAFVPSDAIPGLSWLDIGWYEKKMKKTAGELDVVIEGWLEEHKKKINSSPQVDESKVDQVFMSTLLSHVNRELKEDLSCFSIDTIVKATCLQILGAATDTTTVTLTWALALLVNNPLVLKRAQKEIEDHVGRDREVEEQDLKDLVYLEAIIKDTMRLYPAVPLSVPHESVEDCVVSGYAIPKGTRLLVNIWKIQHDPQIWTNPFEFQPDRFLTSQKEIDVRGQDFELIPFGSGRRMCPGISFAFEAMKLILASMLQAFEFQNPSDEEIDMTESPGLTNFKATPLELLVSPRHLSGLYGVSA